jgi:hypothetical protein
LKVVLYTEVYITAKSKMDMESRWLRREMGGYEGRWVAK